MSSACVCHLNEWCFYCEMYSPLESKFELQEAENAALKQEIEQLKEQLEQANQQQDVWKKAAFNGSGLLVKATVTHVQQVEKIGHLEYQNAALLETMQFYADPATYDLEHLSRHGFIIIDDDGGQQARECLAQIGGTQ